MTTETLGAQGAELSDSYERVQLHIDGEWSEGASGRSQEIINPATGETLGNVPFAAAADLDRALDAAARGFALWRDTPTAERARILHRAADLIRQRAGSIGRTMTLEQGKPLAEATGEVMRGATLLDWDAEEARRAYGRIIPVDPDTELTVIHEPIGVVAGFTPWNFPAGSPMRKIAAALAVGCSIVIKASEEVPGSACAMVRCLEEAGVPPGVVNLVFGVPTEVSEHLIASSITRLVAFTGSVPVGKHLAGLAARGMKPVLMELGGHAPVIVCADADPEQAAVRTAQAKFVNAGQVCTSPSRILVHETIHDRFVEALVNASAAVQVGNGLQPGVKMGPLASQRRLDAVLELVEDARARGAQIAHGGSRLDGPGWFFSPTVLTDVPLEARVMNEEPFGPIASVRSFDDLSEALEIANSLPFGLAAYGFTESSVTASRLKHGLEAGILSINHCSGSVPEAPSGGVKESGYGREGGSEGLEPYLVVKRVSHRLR